MTAPTADLPPIAAPPPRRKLDWKRARTALSTLIADPERVEQVFELIEALEGDAGEKLFQRFLRHPHAPELLARRPSLLSVLSKRSELEALPEGSLGRAYARFMREGGIEADGLVEASQDTRAEHADMDPERLQAFGRREWDAAFEEVRGRGPADAERLAREDDRPPVRLCSGGRLEELHPISEQAQADERLGKLFEGDAPEDPILEGLLRRALAGDAEALRRLPGYLNATDASETTRADALRRLSEGA